MENATVGIRELKDKASSIIDRVEEGEAITVTKNGRPVSMVVEKCRSMAAEKCRSASPSGQVAVAPL